MTKGHKRGYPVAILIGFECERAVVWMIFSQIARLEKIVVFVGNRNDSKALYNFHESLIGVIRSRVKEGIRSVVLASPLKTNYGHAFIEYINQHQSWLVRGQSKLVLSELAGSAGSLSEVTALVRMASFRRLVSETVSEEGEDLLKKLDRSLAMSAPKSLVLYSLEEIEGAILVKDAASKPVSAYLILTDKYLAQSRQKNKLQRLMQVASNRKIKTKIIGSESLAGKRVSQFGGIVYLRESTTAP